MGIATLLDQSLTLERATPTFDASGATSRGYAPILLAVPCAISPASASVAADYARLDMVVNYHLYTTADLDALISGGLQLGDRFADAGHYFMVKAIKKSANAIVMAEPLYQIDCQRILI